MLPIAEKDRRFWDKTAESYAESPIADEDTYQKKLELTRKYLTPESEVFEFGCGTGSTAILHAPYAKHILATDVSENMLKIARQRAEDAGVENITFKQAGIEDFDAGDREFDVVLGLNIIHLCKEPLAVMKKVNNLLKPGGYFIQSTACLSSSMPYIRPVLPLMRLFGKAPRVSMFSSKKLRGYLPGAGFSIAEDFVPGGRSAEFIVAKKVARISTGP